MIRKILLGCCLLACESVVLANTFYVDPEHGCDKSILPNIVCDGSAANPWRRLDKVIANQQIMTKNYAGTILYPNAPVKPGDTLLLRDGFHGNVKIMNYYNDSYITVKADPNRKPNGSRHEPRVSRLLVSNSKNWRFEKLTISQGFIDPDDPSKPVYSDLQIVMLGGKGIEGLCQDPQAAVCVPISAPTSDIQLIDSYIFSTPESKNWTVNDWKTKAKSGVWVGVDSHEYSNFLIKNNYIENVVHGIQITASDTVVEGNVINNFRDDGMRGIRNNITFHHNVVRNNVSIDTNHDDAIQAFYSPITANPLPPIESMNINKNIILNRDSYPETSQVSAIQGIGMFDGPFKKIKITNNVVLAFQYHGISLYDSEQSDIVNNVVYSPLAPPEIHLDEVYAALWISLASKNGLSEEELKQKNMVCGNYAIDYAPNDLPNYTTAYSPFTNINDLNSYCSGAVSAEGSAQYQYSNNTLAPELSYDACFNTTVLEQNEKFFIDKLSKLLKETNQMYGAVHALAKKARVNTGLFIQGWGLSSIFNSCSQPLLQPLSQPLPQLGPRPLPQRRNPQLSPRAPFPQRQMVR